MRKVHAIPPNKSGGFPREFIFVDCESLQDHHDNGDIHHYLDFGYAKYIRIRDDRKSNPIKEKIFYTADEFWNWTETLQRKKSKIVVLAHKASFDFALLNIFEQLKSRDYSIGKVILDEKRIMMKWSKKSKYLTIIDTLNLFAVSVKNLGESVNLEKLPMPDIKAPEKEWIEYCKRDVEIIYRVFMKWRDFIISNGLGYFAFTIAGQSFNAYRHRFMPKKILIHTREDAVKLERDSYTGGRVECFKLGKQPKQKYYHLDINSMYPYIMSKSLMPIRLLAHGNDYKLDRLKHSITKHGFIAHVLIRTDEPCYPYRHNNKLCFPTGTFDTYLTTNELFYALQAKHLLKVYEYNVYEMGYIFKEYVNFFYNKRKEYLEAGNNLYSFLCKLFLNSLYGKFGQKIRPWEYLIEDKIRTFEAWTEYDAKTENFTEYRCIAGKVEVKGDFVESMHSMVAIPSHVTATARLYLWRFILRAGVKNVFYTDTDSLIVNQTGYNRLKKYIHQSNLGGLKIEGTTEKLILKNVKDYEFGSIVKIKGISTKAEKLSENKYRQMQGVSFNGAIRDNIQGVVIWKNQVKNLKRIYGKGTVSSTGAVLPFELDGSNVIPKVNPKV